MGLNKPYVFLEAPYRAPFVQGSGSKIFEWVQYFYLSQQFKTQDECG